MLNYKLTNEQGCIRWENRKDFLNNENDIRKEKNNEIAIICLFYSSFNNIKRIYTYIESEKKSEDFDLILVNNSGKNQNFEHELQNNNIIILTPISNLGTDGGYSLGMEYCIDKGYKYLFLIEDDVTIFDNNAFSDVINKMDEDSVGFITPRINDNNGPQDHSWHVQFACYPISFLKKSGILDPRFFTRGGDGLWVPQVEKAIKDNGYKKVIVNKKHFHPYLKKGNWSARWIYFARRNLFYWNQNRINNYIKLFIYIFNGVSKVTICKSSGFLKGIIFGIYDYILNDMKLNTSLARMRYLTSKNSENDNDTYKNIMLNSMYKYSGGLFSVGLTKQDEELLKTKTNIQALFNKGIVLPNKNSIAYPLSLITKNVIYLNEIYYDGSKFIVNFTNNNKNLVQICCYYLILLFNTIISIAIYIPLLIILIINNHILKRYKILVLE